MFALLLSFTLFTSPALASEVDNISTYYQPVADSTPVLDKYIDDAIEEARTKVRGCDYQAFGDELSRSIVSTRLWTGATERFANHDAGVARLEVSVKDSVYAGTPFASSMVGRFYGLAPVISVAFNKIGSDKLGHFIDHGYGLYRIYAKGGTMSDLTAQATDEEEGAFGFKTTGVKSYADMTADFDGFSFWRNVYGRGDRPYVHCEGGQFVRTRPFRWLEFVNPAWDEAMNCNAYDGELSVPSKDAVELYLEQLDLPANYCDQAYETMRRESAGEFGRIFEDTVAKLERKYGRRYSCPIDLPTCGKVRAMYEKRFGVDVAEKILSPRCR